ncbi:hypothetical protein FHS43_001435 [Streptosporangium becharense]|uniref:Uncharacterized protein n=1 Tax=Streptosporangium becharense TaxID=1816182 RepID=A0A7W9ILG0_9ACTN|nr:hypothetical protein [Streptosporangium becharense]MBB5822915.1 hypothetical protein [Streptosporangium becharense]
MLDGAYGMSESSYLEAGAIGRQPADHAETGRCLRLRAGGRPRA